VKKFAFRLQRVLDIREAREKLKLAELGREQQRLLAEQQKLRLFETEKENQVSEIRQERSEPFKIWMQTTSQRYLQRVARVVEFQHGRVEEQNVAVVTARDHYVEARRETNVMERLREIKKDEWTHEGLLEEGKVLDEVGSRKRSEIDIL
jgi:flagellar export protein FliJ